MATPPLPSRLPRFALLDLAVALWVAAWLAIATLAGFEIRELQTYGDTLVQSGEALDTAGSALQALGPLPVVGESSERLGDEVRATADEVRRSARQTEDSVAVMSVLLAVSIALAPTVPVLAVYLPWRSWRRRQAGAVLTALAGDRPDALEELLARRAAARVDYDTLLAVTTEPWRDVDEGRTRLLANAELTRLGLGRRGGLLGE